MRSYNFFNNFKFINSILNLSLNAATLDLLRSSILVAISGAFRVYIAALLLDTHVSMLLCIAGGLIIYSVYTLDRTLDSEEDRINRTELCGSCKEIGFAASILSFVVGCYIMAKKGLLWIALVPLVTGFLYSKGIKIGKYSLRLKGGLGVKNLIVGLSWGLFITGLACSTCKNVISIILVFILYCVKVFVNSAIDDFKDIKGDAITGIRTLPVYFGDIKTRNFLLGLHLFSHLILGIALLKGLIAFEPLILICSFLCGALCIIRYTNEEKYIRGKVGLAMFKDGESSLIVLLSVVTNAL